MRRNQSSSSGSGRASKRQICNNTTTTSTTDLQDDDDESQTHTSTSDDDDDAIQFSLPQVTHWLPGFLQFTLIDDDEDSGDEVDGAEPLEEVEPETESIETAPQKESEMQSSRSSEISVLHLRRGRAKVEAANAKSRATTSSRAASVRDKYERRANENLPLQMKAVSFAPDDFLTAAKSDEEMFISGVIHEEDADESDTTDSGSLNTWDSFMLWDNENEDDDNKSHTLDKVDKKS